MRLVVMIDVPDETIAAAIAGRDPDGWGANPEEFAMMLTRSMLDNAVSATFHGAQVTSFAMFAAPTEIKWDYQRKLLGVAAQCFSARAYLPMTSVRDVVPVSLRAPRDVLGLAGVLASMIAAPLDGTVDLIAGTLEQTSEDIPFLLDDDQKRRAVRAFFRGVGVLAVKYAEEQ